MASILVIDDDAPIRLSLVTALTRHGYAVRAASHGVEGLQLFRAEPADLVITDLVMPEQDGLATIMELRRIAPAIRIIAISGGMIQNPQLYLKLAEKLGADRVLSKPFTLQELLTVVAEVFALPNPPPPPAAT
jgi:CheY-like chemotaxis protein